MFLEKAKLSYTFILNTSVCNSSFLDLSAQKCFKEKVIVQFFPSWGISCLLGFQIIGLLWVLKREMGKKKGTEVTECPLANEALFGGSCSQEYFKFSVHIG